MGSYVEINDTLQITKEQGFPKELDWKQHQKTPYTAEQFADKIFEFSNKPSIRNYQMPPVRNFLVENKVKVKKLIFVCGFNKYLGVNEEYDAVNESMYFDNLKDVKKYANEIICFYSDNDPYVKYEKEKEFADTIATEKVMLKGAGHINAETGFDTFEDIVAYL